MVDKCSHLGRKCTVNLQDRRINQQGKKWRCGRNTGSTAIHRLLTYSDISEIQSFFPVSVTISSLKMEKAIFGNIVAYLPEYMVLHLTEK